VIIYDLTSSQWYFNYIEDEDKCYDMQKLCNKQRRERAKVKRDNDFGLPLENYGYLVRDEQFSLLYWERGFYYYDCVNTSDDGLLVDYVFITMTVSIPLMVDY
jgi:hypothetical protein